MKKWFNELLVGDIIAHSKFKSYPNGLGYFDDQDCDYLQIDKINQGIIYTTNLETKGTMELWCGESWDEWVKKPSFEIVNQPVIKTAEFKPIQLNLFDLI